MESLIPGPANTAPGTIDLASTGERTDHETAAGTVLTDDRTRIQKGVMRWLTGIVLIGCLVLSDRSQGGESPLDLMKQLGHPSFQRRVEAERRLLEMGPAGIEAAAQGVLSADPEIRRRSQRLMVTLQRLAIHECLEQIRENPWTAPPELTPAWDFYHLLAGDSAAARDLYVAMIEQEIDLMLEVVRNPENWQEEFERRCEDLRSMVNRRSYRDVEPAGIAALLFLAVHPDNSPSTMAAGLLNQLTSDTRFNRELRSQAGTPLLALLSHWIEHGPHSTPRSRLTQAMRFQLPAGLPAAREIIKNRHSQGSSQPMIQLAIHFLASYGDVEDMELLDELLEDETRLSSRGSRDGRAEQAVDLQVNDVALLALLQVTEQDPATYGFSNIRTVTSYGNQYLTATFASAELRLEALTKWAIWRIQRSRSRPVAEQDASEGTLL